MMDQGEVSDAVHDISMLMEVLVRVVEKLQANDATPRVFELPYVDGELASFVTFDLYKRINALRDGLT